MMRCLAVVQGRQRAVKVPLNSRLLTAALELEPGGLVQERDTLLVAVGALTCSRPSEVARLQACDALFDFDSVRDPMAFKGTMALRIYKRKQDQERKGHWPRLGRGGRPQLDVVGRLRRFVRAAGIRVLPGCTKSRRPAARCPVCWPLFPKIQTAQCDVLGARKNCVASGIGVWCHQVLWSRRWALATLAIGRAAGGSGRRGANTGNLSCHRRVRPPGQTE